MKHALVSRPSSTACDAIRLLIVDSSHIGSESLAAALKRGPFQMIYAGASRQEALSELAHKRVDVALISASVDGHVVKGYEIASQIRICHPQVQIVMLVDNPDRDTVVQAFRSGARGVFCRSSSLNALCKCVTRVHQGQVWASSEELQHLLEALMAPPRMRLVDTRGTDLLAPREQEVVHWVSEGLTNREIADRLSLSENTIKNYLFRIFDKLGVSKRVELILYAASQFAPTSPKGATAQPDVAPAFNEDGTLFRWCREAAEQFAVNQYMLGEMYRDGRGVPPDKSAALMWFLIAQKVSAESASKSRTARLELQRQMTTKEVADAKYRAAEWLNKRQQDSKASTA